MLDDRLFLGLDLGTSGARALVIDAEGRTLATAKAALADFGDNPRRPAVWLVNLEGLSLCYSSPAVDINTIGGLG